MALFGLAHVIILPVLFHTIYRMPYFSIALYFQDASKVMAGGLPYRDFLMEYPPFALVFFLLPRLFTSSLAVYSVAFQAEVFLFDLLGLYLIYRIAQHKGKAPWKMLAVYSAVILAVGPEIINSFDIFAAILVLSSLYCFWKGKHKTSWIILALSVMTKIYPVVIAPIFLLSYLKNGEYKRIWSGIMVFAVCVLVISIPFLVMSPHSFFKLITFHADRPLQLETTYSSILMFISRFSSISLNVNFSSGSNNIIGRVPETLSQISVFLSAFLLLMSYWLIYCRMKKGKNDLGEIGVYSLLVIAILLITSKILSPQYLIWLLPLLPLLAGKKLYIIGALFVVIEALTYYIFPVHYVELGNFTGSVALVLLIRNILLVLLTILVGVAVFRSSNNRPSISQTS